VVEDRRGEVSAHQGIRHPVFRRTLPRGILFRRGLILVFVFRGRFLRFFRGQLLGRGRGILRGWSIRKLVVPDI
jgi:hypothetical protein